MTVWETHVHRYSDLSVSLSRAEKRVMDLMAQGFGHHQVAALLHLSIHTVQSHTKNVRSRLAVPTTDAAIVRLRGLGFLDG